MFNRSKFSLLAKLQGVLAKSSLFDESHTLFTLFNPVVYFAGRGRRCDEQGDGS